MTDAISGTRRQMRELVDGTIEVKIHIDPRFKSDFNRLFPNIDAPVALAPLVRDFERRDTSMPSTDSADMSIKAEKIDTSERKGGPISKWLGARCNEPTFWTFLDDYVKSPDDDPIFSPSEAADLVRRVCGVTTRAEIDHDPKAREQFDRVIREPYQKYLKGE